MICSLACEVKDLMSREIYDAVFVLERTIRGCIKTSFVILSSSNLEVKHVFGRPDEEIRDDVVSVCAVGAVFKERILLENETVTQNECSSID
jgi:hypothetical protein